MRFHRRHSAAIAAAALLLAATGCSTATGPESADLVQFTAGTVSARVNGSNLEVHNGTSSARSFAVIERDFFEHGLASWCMGSDGCGAPIAAGETIALPVSSIQYYSATASEAIVFWWMRPAPQAANPAEVQQLVVSLR